MERVFFTAEVKWFFKHLLWEENLKQKQLIFQAKNNRKELKSNTISYKLSRI